MLQLEQSTPESIEMEVAILNTNPFYNRLSKNKDALTIQEVAQDNLESEAIGARRFLLKDGETYVGILEWLPVNPKDGYPWLGLLLIDQSFQSAGYGTRALQTFYGLMREQGIGSFRIGVIEGNGPAHSFWKKHGFAAIRNSRTGDGLEVVVYEKDVP